MSNTNDVNYRARRNFGVFLMVIGFLMIIFPIMSSDNMVFRILIGLIAVSIMIIGYYTYLRNESYLASTVRSVWPPFLYFQKIGAYCPDYWTYEGIDSTTKKTKCRNSFGIDVWKNGNPNKGKCYDNASDPTLKSFTTPNFQNIYKSVDQFEKDNVAYKNEACDFINNCGPDSNNPRATWFGVGTQNGYFKC